MPGPFYLAWVDPTETTFGVEHHRSDEDVFALTVEQQEGEFPSATVDVRNPRVGLLNGGRKRWAWLSWDSRTTAGVVPLLFGRLVAIPQDLQAEALRLEFIARPTDWDAQRAAIGATLKSAPAWDPVFVPADRVDDPDALLEARTALWHIDRIDHEVSISDILQGEDGTLDLGGDFAYDSLSVGYGSAPKRRVTVEATVQWNQAGAGVVDLTKALLAATKAAHSGNGKFIATLTGDGLAADWPAKGDSIGGGWTVDDSYVIRGDGKWIAEGYTRAVSADGNISDFPTWSFRPVFWVAFDASRSRTEKITVTLEADIQSVLTEPGDDEAALITTTSTRIDELIDPDESTAGFAAPIGDARRRSYFQTDRGHRSIEYLICLARSFLIAKARCATIRFTTRWDLGLGLSCRRSVSISDPRIPGGAAVGKVIAYSLSASGDSGVMKADVTIACAIGHGGTITTSSGTPTYVDAGYVDAGYQIMAGAALSTGAGDVTYTPPDGQATPDDGVDLANMTPGNSVVSITITGAKKDQDHALTDSDVHIPDMQAAISILGEIYTRITVTMVPLNGGPFETDYALTVSDLVVPRMLDLEAAP